MLQLPRRRCALVLWTLVCSIGLAPQASAEVPDWIKDRDGIYPIWVSADEAAPNGLVRWELFPPVPEQNMRSLLDSDRKGREKANARGETPVGCVAWLAATVTASGAWSPKEFYQWAGAIYSTRVRDIAQGFLGGNAGTLVEVSVERVIKPPSEGEALTWFYVFHPYAEIQVEDGYLCSRGQRPAATPAVGGKLILAPRNPEPDWPGIPIFYGDDPEVFFEGEEGAVSKPYGYRDVEIRIDSLEASLFDEREKEVGE